MLNTMMEDERKSFITISIFSEIIMENNRICDHDHRKGMKIINELLFLFSVIVFNMMKLLPKVKIGKTMIKESNKATNRLN